MRIIIDADATPIIKRIEFLAIKYKLECILIKDHTHELYSDYSNIITVSKGNNSADLYIINSVKENDLVISADYEVAALSLTKKCIAVNPKGFEYTNTNIDSLLMTRYLNKKSRDMNVRIKGPKKRTEQDNINLLNLIEELIQRGKLNEIKKTSK